MENDAKIYVAGHRGLVGSALIRKLQKVGYKNIIVRTHMELDLTRQSDVESFFEREKPEFVFLAAAKVGGILANSTYKAGFIYDNIMIAANVIHASYKYKIKKLLNLGSSCIYPKFAPQPMKEEYLLTGSLEPTNEPYAIAKISAVKLCRYFNEQYGTDFISVMPTNLYGPNDNYDLETSHVLPAIIRKFHLAKLLSEKRYGAIIKDLLFYNDNFTINNAEQMISNNAEQIFGNSIRQTISNNNTQQLINYLVKFGIYPDKIVLWGTGTPYREFLHVDDLADAVVFLMQKYHAKEIGEFMNIGTGKGIQIKDLAIIIKKIIDYKGEVIWDASKPDGTPKKLLDVSRINKLGWLAKIDLCKGLELSYGEYTKNKLYVK